MRNNELVATVILLVLVFAVAAPAQTGKFEGVFTGKFTLNGNGSTTTTPKVTKPSAPAVPKPTTFTLRLDDLRQLLADARTTQPAFAPVPVIVQQPALAPDHAVEAARIQAAGQIEAARIQAAGQIEAARIQKEIEGAKLTAQQAEMVVELSNRLEVARINHGRLRDKILVALIGAGGRLGQGALTRTTISFGNIGNPTLSNIGNPILSNIGNPSQVATLTGGNQTAILRGGNAQATAVANATNLNISDDRWNYRGNGCYVTPFGVICLPKP